MNKKSLHISELQIKENFIGKIAKLFVNRFELTALVILLLVTLGVSSFFLLPKESLPEIVFPTLTVQTIYPGAAPEDVERFITVPIENTLGELDDVTDISSNSLYGFSFITVTFDESVDIDQKTIQLDNALSSVSLPDNAFEPTSSSFSTSEIPLVSISLTGDYDVYTLNDYANELSSSLTQLPGVEAVNIFGGVDREIQVTLNPEALETSGLTANDVTTTIRSNNINFPLGDATIDGNIYRVRIDESYSTLDSLKNMTLYNQQGQSYLLSDLALVELASKDLTTFNRSYTRDSGLNNSVFISVIRKNKADVLNTSSSVKDTVSASIGSTLPNDISAVITNDTAINVQDDLSSIQNNALSGLLVVILVLFLFIGFRESLIVSLTIPLTLLTTLGLLSFFGITLNTFAILGLIVALGLLVDNTIIVMENMDRLRKIGVTPKEAAIAGTNQVGLPITAATLTTVAAFFPLAILPGIIGAFINTIPRTIIIALLTSLLLAVIITPSIYYLVNKNIKKDVTTTGPKAIIRYAIQLIFVSGLSFIAFYGDTLWIGIPIIASVFFTSAFIAKILLTRKARQGDKLLNVYSQFIQNVTASKVKMALILLIAVAVLGSSFNLIISGKLKIAFFPETEPISISLSVDAPAGTSLDETSNIMSEIEAILINSPDVKQFNTTVGGSASDVGNMVIDLEDNDNNGFEQLDNLRAQLATITSAKLTFQGNGAGGPPVGQPIEIKVKGNDVNQNLVIINEFKDILSSIEGTYNIESSITEGTNTLQLDIDNEAAASYGLSPGYIAFAINTLLDGEVATTLSLNDELIDVRVKSEGNSLNNLEALSIATPFGTQVPLSDIVSLESIDGLSNILREDGDRTITLSADLESEYNAAEVLEVFKARADLIEIPESTLVLYEGESAGINESFGNLFRSMIIAIFLVFIILTIQFSSIKQPLIIISTVPMALIGVLYGLTMTGNEFGFYAFMALVSLIGIAVNDAIVLIDYMNYLRKQGKSFYEAIGQATKTRFNPVLATTLTTIGGILPLSFKNAYYAQFGYSLIFGLFITTLMTLIIIPVMYSLFEGKAVRKASKKRRRSALATAFSAGVIK